MAACLGVPSRPDVVTLSAVIAHGHQDVGSYVGVPLGVLPPVRVRIPEAAREIAAFASPRGRACNLSYLRATIAPSHQASLSVTPLPNPTSGLDGSVAYRFHVWGITTIKTRTGDEISARSEIGLGKLPPHAKVHRVALSLYFDVDVFVMPKDGGLVELFAEDNSRPPPARTDRRALSLLYTRAKALSLWPRQRLAPYTLIPCGGGERPAHRL
jgi:hypothetical protein